VTFSASLQRLLLQRPQLYLDYRSMYGLYLNYISEDLPETCCYQTSFLFHRPTHLFPYSAPLDRLFSSTSLQSQDVATDLLINCVV